jgi:hypothetical protein
MQKQEAWLSQLFPFDCNDTWYFVIIVIADPVAKWYIEKFKLPELHNLSSDRDDLYTTVIGTMRAIHHQRCQIVSNSDFYNDRQVAAPKY